MVEKLKPWLWLPPQFAHDYAPLFLKLATKLRTPTPKLTWGSKKWKYLRFTNPVGIAGGVDKNAESLKDWWRWGPGFIEVGTITPEPQSPNPGKVMDRNLDRLAVWNKMGFPSKGLKYATHKLARLKYPHFTPVFANIGKNRETPLRSAYKDYIRCIQVLHSFADAFVVNISSPNTEGLRRLAEQDNLHDFLEPLVATNKSCTNEHYKESIPLLLKISPDMEDKELETLLNVSFNVGVDGWIFSNSSNAIGAGLNFPLSGGISGRPLSERSKSTLKKALEILGSDRDGKLIVSCGGILTPQDVFERLDMGADLVQVYSALVFEGPYFFKNVARAALQRKSS